MTLLISLSAPAVKDALHDGRLPNIVLIVTDDQGYADLGFQGSTYITTPHVDALANAGIRFSNAYVSHPYCSPTRAGLMTGRYQQRFGHESNPAFLPESEEIGLPVDEETLADVLGRGGYSTGAFGKWHLGAGPPFHPLRRGFGEFFGFLGGGHDYFEAKAGSADEYSTLIEHNGRHVGLTGYLTDVLSQHAVDFIYRHRNQPFFLYLAFNAPHTPYQAPEGYCARFGNLPDDDCRTYAAMISAVDDGVGRIVETLHALELAEDTLIIFLSDNGGQTLYDCADNRPLRGRKGHLYEGGVRVPFVVVWPGRIEAGRHFDAPVSSLDIFPTCAAAARAEASGRHPGDGVNLMPFLDGEIDGEPHKALFWRVGGGVSWAVRQGSWKLLRHGQKVELFDLAADLGETRNLADEHPGRVREMTALYRTWNAATVPPRWPDP